MHINIENIYSVVELKVKLIVIINTVHFPLIADRRSVIVPGVPFIFKRKIKKICNCGTEGETNCNNKHCSLSIDEKGHQKCGCGTRGNFI